MTKPIEDYTVDELSVKMDKLEKAKKTLRIYANRSNWDTNYTDSFCCTDGWEMAQDCLKEIEE